jgi:phage baseplate assembly protein W
MPTFIGFSTVNVDQPRNIVRTGIDGGVGNIRTPPKITRKFKLVDDQLVVQDFVNAFNIKQGDKVGQPGYGTTIWFYVFEPNTQSTREQIENEVRRVASLDPRILLNDIAVFEQDNGVLIEVQMVINPYNSEVQVQFLLNRFTNSVDQLS